jgi:hypothetical protein
LRKERVVARIEFNDVACSTRELALRIGGRAVIVGTHSLNSSGICFKDKTKKWLCRLTTVGAPMTGPPPVS